VRNIDSSPYVDDRATYSPADLKQDAECHQQQQHGAGVTTEWPYQWHGHNGHAGMACRPDDWRATDVCKTKIIFQFARIINKFFHSPIFAVLLTLKMPGCLLDFQTNIFSVLRTVFLTW
jgi:hypothetical protein